MGHTISRATRLGLQHLVANVRPGELDWDGVQHAVRLALHAASLLIIFITLQAASSSALGLGLQDLVADVCPGQLDLNGVQDAVRLALHAASLLVKLIALQAIGTSAVRPWLAAPCS